MKVVIIYRPYSDHGRAVDNFVAEFTRRYTEGRIEVLNIDGRDGGAMASLYDIMSYPAVLALRDDGSAMMVWQGEQLPLIDEVAGYAVAL